MYNKVNLYPNIASELMLLEAWSLPVCGAVQCATLMVTGIAGDQFLLPGLDEMIHVRRIPFKIYGEDEKFLVQHVSESEGDVASSADSDSDSSSAWD
jgi:hypothetical protein